MLVSLSMLMPTPPVRSTPVISPVLLVLVSNSVSRSCSACLIVLLSYIVLPVKVPRFSSVSADAPANTNK